MVGRSHFTAARNSELEPDPLEKKSVWSVQKNFKGCYLSGGGVSSQLSK